MIIVKLTGGLGNQMFQYAFGRTLSIKHNCKLMIDDSWYREYDKIEDVNDPNKATKRNYLLKHFNIAGKILPRYYLRVNNKIEQIRRSYPKIIPNQLFNFQTIIENNFEWSNIKNNYKYLVVGYWQKSLHFEKYKDIINYDFKLKKALSNKNNQYYEQILTTNSVAIHVRRGDLLTKPNGKKLQPICTLEYYYSGITAISDNSKDLTIFIFSDDMEWCKNNFDNSYPITFVDSVGTDHEHFYLMSQCKHQVIANSTYSWWAAWLNNNPDKIIIAPKDWYRSKELNETAIHIPNEWILITNKGILYA